MLIRSNFLSAFQATQPPANEGSETAETPAPTAPAEAEEAPIVVTPPSAPQAAGGANAPTEAAEAAPPKVQAGGSAAAAEGAIVVRPQSGAVAPETQTPKAKGPCLQLPEYPKGGKNLFRPKTIEEYKALLMLATRNTWKANFSEADYLYMEEMLGMDRYRPKQPNRICKAEPSAPSSQPSESSKDSSSLRPITDTLPHVVVPATPNRSLPKGPGTRPRGTYY